MITASHNPAKYNGIKLCRAGARPVGADTGLTELREMAARGVPAPARPGRAPSTSATCCPAMPPISRPWSTCPASGRSRWPWTPATAWRATPCRKVFDGLPIDTVPLYFELDGTFPNHEANPIDPANLADLQRAVRASGADIGLAFDGDADRCFVVDERGEIVSPSVLTALIAVRELAAEPGAAIIHNLITSRAVPEIVAEHGGTAGADQGRPLVHQGGDGQHRSGLRRRALRALLLQGLLVRRFRDARRLARAGRPRKPGRAAVRRCWPPTPGTWPPARSTAR